MYQDVHRSEFLHTLSDKREVWFHTGEEDIISLLHSDRRVHYNLYQGTSHVTFNIKSCDKSCDATHMSCDVELKSCNTHYIPSTVHNGLYDKAQCKCVLVFPKEVCIYMYT